MTTLPVEPLRAGVHHLARACAGLAGLCFFAIFLINAVQIAMRTFFGGGFLWVTDLSQLLFVWMVMLGVVVAYHQRGHIVVDFVVARFQGRSELALATAVRAIELVLFASLVYAGIQVTLVRTGIAYIQLGLPTSWAFAAVPTAGTLLLLAALVLPLRFEREAARDDVEPPEGDQE
ncbi:TRAP transporter small permease subunit [Egibacter rhizosphaerae]|uniref:TRAP transporter small permease subunit n=1 Tax=Egibacter rhizosphaerae TaxID=1670831 RepID=A0A411YB32_9ACTN|nr:TRAP transporter small permease [Egibacter rhizosphaerae]QBI18421.1 TRAP transporter small permease subunit [Egibacter rhizosphaerae]